MRLEIAVDIREAVADRRDHDVHAPLPIGMLKVVSSKS
jgi:hypothetical protein